MSFTLWSPREASGEDLLVMELPKDVLSLLEHRHERAVAASGGDLLAGAAESLENEPEVDVDTLPADLPGSPSRSLESGGRAGNGSDGDAEFSAVLMSSGPDSQLYFVTPSDTYELRFLDSTNTHAIVDASPRELSSATLTEPNSRLSVLRFYSSIVEFRKCCPQISDLLAAIPVVLPRSSIGNPFYLSSFPRERIIGSVEEIFSRLAGLWCCKYPAEMMAPLAVSDGAEQPLAVFDVSVCCPGLAHLCATTVDEQTGGCLVSISEAVDTIKETTDDITAELSYSVLPFLCRTIEGRAAGPLAFSEWLQTDSFPKYNVYGSVQLSPLKILAGLLLDQIARLSLQARERSASGLALGDVGEFALQQVPERLPFGVGPLQTASGQTYHSVPFTLGALARGLAAESYPAEFYIAAASEACTHLEDLELGLSLAGLAGAPSEGVPLSLLYDQEGMRPTALLLAAVLLPRPLSAAYWTPVANCWIGLQTPVTGDTRALWYDRKALPASVLDRVFSLSDVRPAEAWHGATLEAMCSECCESPHASSAAVLAATRRSGAACDGHDLLRVKPEKRYALGAAAMLRK